MTTAQEGWQPRAATSVSFTEDMKGWVAWGEADPVTGAAVGRERGERLTFRLTITADDVDAFVADPAHEASATGHVHYDMLGGRLPVERGWFNLFVVEGDPRTRAMRYRLHVRDAGGNPVTLLGRKDVGDDPGLDLWHDNTTLLTRMYAGHLDAPPPTAAAPIAAGIITIAVADFARQLTTFRAHGPRPAYALALFGRHFLGELWTVYGPGRPRRRLRRGPTGGETP